MDVVEEGTVCSSLISDIESCGGWMIIAFNNDITPFNLVFWTLKSAVPLEEPEAYDKTYEIHVRGFAVVYIGNKAHCETIQAKLDQIKVKSMIVQP